VRERDAGREHAHLEIWQTENNRVYGVLERGLSDREYLAGEYSIADIAAFPWIYRHDMQEINLDLYPNVRAWLGRVGERSAVQRGLQIPPRNDGF